MKADSVGICAGRGFLVLFLPVALAVVFGGTGCDDFNSMVACQHYCDRNFECVGSEPTDDDFSTCVANCRDSIENECGNEYQAEANDHIEDCVDMGCVGFWACMVFDAAPQCYGFVSQ